MNSDSYKATLQILIDLQRRTAQAMDQLPNVWANSLGLKAGEDYIYKPTGDRVNVTEFYVRYNSGSPELVAWATFTNPVERSNPVAAEELGLLPQEESCEIGGLQIEL